MRQSAFGIVVVSMLASVLVSYAEPKTPKDAIPKGLSGAVRKQVERLYSSDPIERNEACDELAAMGEKAVPAIPFLVETLNDRTPVMRNTRVGDQTVVSSATPGLQAGRAILKMGKPGLDALSGVLEGNGQDEEAQRNVVRIMGESENPATVPLLIKALKHKSEWVRYDAAWSLGALKSKDAIPHLIGLLEDSVNNVRSEAAYSLKKITGEDFGPDSAKWKAWMDTQKKPH